MQPLSDGEKDEDEEEEQPPQAPTYEPVTDVQVLLTRLEALLQKYNKKNRRQRMNLVFFEYAVEHVIRISRILCSPRGNAVLVGVGGSGKQSLARLAAFISHCQVFQPSLSKVKTVLSMLLGNEQSTESRSNCLLPLVPVLPNRCILLRNCWTTSRSSTALQRWNRL